MAEFSGLERQTDLPVDKTQYIPDEYRRLLRIWKKRVRRYFPQIRRRSTIE